MECVPIFRVHKLYIVIEDFVQRKLFIIPDSSVYLFPDSSFYTCSIGLELVKETVRNNLDAGVIEPAKSKVKILQVERPAG